MWLKTNWKLCLALVLIIALSWIETQYITEGTGVESVKRKIYHVVFLGGIYAVGLWYWAQQIPSWLKSVWTFSYAGLLALLFVVGVLSWKFGIFSTDFLDQIHHVRTFFCSPLPFLVILALTKMDIKLAGTPSNSYELRQNR